MKIAIVGLALSHPYRFGEVLSARNIEIACVWDYEHSKAGEYCRQFGGEVMDDIERIADAGVDGVMIDTKNGDHAKYALPFIAGGVPTFIDKPMVTNRADLDRILEAVKEHGTPIMSTSIMRYAPPMVKAKQFIESGQLGTILGATSVVMHGIGGYMNEPHKWQDNIEMGGGSIINMGIHGMEPLVMAMGTGISSVHCYSSKREFLQSQSEDTAIISCKYADGRVGNVVLMCGTKAHGYDLTIFGSEKAITAGAPGFDVRGYLGGPLGEADHRDAYGYTATVEAFLRMCETGEPPIPLEETAEVMRALLAARESAAENCEIPLAEVG